MEEERVRTHATGEVFTGRKALELGLVDELGDLETALGIAARMGGVSTRRRPKYIRARGPLRARLFGGMGASLAETVIEETERRLMERVYYQAWG